MQLTGVPAASRRHATLVLGALLAAAAAALLALEWGVSPVETAHRALAAIREAGPVAYFSAMAIVPLPLSWFTLPAAEAFAAPMTLGGVIAAALTAMALHLAFIYWLARWALRPWLEALVRHYGAEVPRASASNALALSLLVKLTPGPPLFLQCCVLALAGIPFGTYFIVSWLTTAPWVVGGVILGKGLLRGSLGFSAAGAGLLVAAAAAAALWRRRNQKA